MQNRTRRFLAATLIAGCVRVLAAPSAANAETAAPAATETEVERGRYLVSIGGCNDCHTPGFMQAPGQIPESDWLTGVPVGWRGPWGTTYASNLRLRVQELTEDEWVFLLRERKAMPPMPWFSVNALKEEDSRILYRYLKHLGPKGEPTPGFLPPIIEPTTPYLSMDLQHASAGQQVQEMRMERPPVSDQ